MTNILQGIGIHGRISSWYDENECLHIDVEGRDCGAAIGRHGETLDAINYLTGLVVNRNSHVFQRVIVDIGGYRRRRENKVADMAERLAERVIRSGENYRMKPMTPAERRIVHITLQDFPGIETHSEGEEPDRFVIIAPSESE